MADLILPSFKSGDVLKAKDLQRMADTIGALTNSDRGDLLHSMNIAGMKFKAAYQQPQYNIPFKNNSGFQVPAYGIVRLTGYDTLSSGAITVGRPNNYGCRYDHFINGPQPIDDGDVGMCTNTFPATVAYDPADGTPSTFGIMWGPRSGSFLAKILTGGFSIVGNPDTTDFTVQVIREPFFEFIGVTDAAIAKGATGTISIYYSQNGSAPTDTGVNMDTVQARYDAVGSGKLVRVRYFCDQSAWEIVNAEC